CHQLLAARGIGLPATVFGDNPDDTADLLSLLGPPPHVVKLNEGTQGAGVMLTEKLSASRGVGGALGGLYASFLVQALVAQVEALRGLYANFLVQEFVAEAEGADLRCFVVGDRVVAAMRRTAPAGDFRSNLHRGGSANAAQATPGQCAVAVAAAAAVGLGVAGVDLIDSRRGPLVLEVNASPGLEGIEDATGIDIAAKIVEFAVKSSQKSGSAPRL